MKLSQAFKLGFGALNVKSPRLRQVGIALASILLILLASAAFLILRAYIEGQEVREYVGGPFSAQLLYLQGCTAGASGNGGQEAAPQTLEEQIDLCRRTGNSRAGYYVYDFNIKRSVALSEKDLEAWKKYAVLSFPASLGGEVRNSETNEFNRIVPFKEFSGFKYDCTPDDNSNDFSCKVAAASCEFSGEAIQCTVFNPHTDSNETHLIERDGALDLLVPHGFIAGPDLFKLLRTRFFPILDRM